MKTTKRILLDLWLYRFLFNKKKQMLCINKLNIFKNNQISVSNEILKHINLDVVGKNNLIVIPDSFNGKLNVSICGDNNCVIIDDGVYAGQLQIVVGQNHKNFGPVHDCKIKIGKNTAFESTNIITYNSGAEIKIGQKCMFSFNITLFHTDAHPILDVDTGKIINKVKKMQIGDHVWIGAGSTILKNTTIADDCIVGWGSVVSGKFDIKNVAIAGNPAKIVKRNITWNSDGSKGYVQNEK